MCVYYETAIFGFFEKTFADIHLTRIVKSMQTFRTVWCTTSLRQILLSYLVDMCTYAKFLNSVGIHAYTEVITMQNISCMSFIASWEKTGPNIVVFLALPD